MSLSLRSLLTWYFHPFSGLAALMCADIARHLWSLVCSCPNSYCKFHLFPRLSLFQTGCCPHWIESCSSIFLFSYMIMDLPSHFLWHSSWQVSKRFENSPIPAFTRYINSGYSLFSLLKWEVQNLVKYTSAKGLFRKLYFRVPNREPKWNGPVRPSIQLTTKHVLI